ncbi:MAG: hypothetical protein WCT53_00070 [Candidatus Gracilibacteria bacterium]
MQVPEHDKEDDPYRDGRVPNRGEVFNEGGRMVYWNCISLPVKAEGQQPLEIRQVGDIFIAKWEEL